MPAVVRVVVFPVPVIVIHPTAMMAAPDMPAVFVVMMAIVFRKYYSSPNDCRHHKDSAHRLTEFSNFVRSTTSTC